MKKISKFLSLPGSIRIVSGCMLVSALIILALFGDSLSKYSAQEMNPQHALSPPSLDIFRSLLVTDKGMRLLNLNRQAQGLPPIGDKSVQVKEAPKLNQDDDLFAELEKGEGADKEVTSEEIESNNIPPHLFGTDKDGRDMLALLLEGARTALLPGLLAALVALGLGVPAGLFSGYFGGIWSSIIDFFSGVVLSFPRLVLILVVICAAKPDVYYVMGLLGITLIPRVSGLIATRVRSLSKGGFILAAREAGLKNKDILFRHILWYQSRPVIYIQFSLIMAESILIETTLSYLQFGTKPPAVSWGNIIEGSQMTFFSESYWITAFPAAAIILAILGFFYLGDGINARMAHREGR